MAGGSSYRFTKRSRKNDNDGLAWFIAIIITVIVFSAIWIFQVLVAIIKFIINLFNSKSKKTKSRHATTTNNFIKQTPQLKSVQKNEKYPKKLNSYVDSGPEVTYIEKTLRLPERVIETPYDELFLPQIKSRGEEYFLDNKISNFKIENNKCTATISGTENYDASLEFYKNKKIKKVSCTCPYYQKDEKYCKHLYALLLHYCN